MKRLLIPVIAFVFLFSGCSRTFDINERLIVQGVGIDYVSENEVEVTVQALNTDTYAGIGGAKVPDKLVKNYVLKGKTVASALSKLNSFSGKEPLYTHTRIILLGKELAENGIKNVIDFFSRDSSCRASLYVAVCDGRAGDFLKNTDDSQSVPSVEIENAVGASQFGGDTVNVHIYELIKMYREKTTSAFLPVVSLDEKDKEKAVSVSGTAVLDSDRGKQIIGESDTQLLMLFLNRTKYGTYTLDSFDGNASFDFYKTRCRTDVSKAIKDETVFNVKIKCVFDCVEFSDKKDSVLDGGMLKELENLLEKELERKMSSFLYRMSRNGNDCMRLGRVLLLKDKKQYRQKENDWRQALSSAGFNVNVDVSIRRIGQESNESAF
ncbi:MAG: Ger(x)C family spore germination protein [Clostridia bacterium]|nr:Ger(x)C family spore germination protein [Clostridia bacterium]